MKGYRTLIVNALMVAAGLAGTSVSPELAGEYADAFILLWGAANVVLRVITTGPLFNRATPPSINPGGPAVGAIAVFLIAGGLLLPLGGCATPVAETPAQKVYALQSDLQAAQQAALAVVTAPGVPERIKSAVKGAEAAAVIAVKKAQAAVRAGDDPAVPVLLAAAREALSVLHARTASQGAVR